MPSCKYHASSYRPGWQQWEVRKEAELEMQIRTKWFVMILLLDYLTTQVNQSASILTVNDRKFWCGLPSTISSVVVLEV